MPYSDIWNVPVVMGWVSALQPKRVLDVGVGFGKYGFLCREALELSHNRYHRRDWQVRIEGVEIFSEYHTPNWDYAYDKVHIGPAEQVIPTLESFDVGLFCDVIEHFEKPVGQRVLDALLGRCRQVIVSTPVVFMPQTTTFENEAENHVSFFSPLDFSGYHHRYAFAGGCFLALLSREPLPDSLGPNPSSNGARLRFMARAAQANGALLLQEHLPESFKPSIKRVLRSLRLYKD